MAGAFLRKYGEERFVAESAGLEPGTVNPLVMEVMNEEGIDLCDKGTESVYDYYRDGRSYDYVITECSKDAYKERYASQTDLSFSLLCLLIFSSFDKFNCTFINLQDIIQVKYACSYGLIIYSKS